MNHPEHRVWTGGSDPASIHDISVAEYAYAMELYFEDCGIWSECWKQEMPADIREVFWRRARDDAHATYRVAGPAIVYMGGS